VTRRLVLACVLAAACGVKTRPLAPELVRPTAPIDLAATSTAEGVKLTWRRPTTYTSGKHMRDLGGFSIERASGAEGIDFLEVGTLELTDQTRFRQERSMTWTDQSAVAGETYRYRVIATTTDDYRSAPGGPVTVAHRGKPAKP
jgi:hypothetical protein